MEAQAGVDDKMSVVCGLLVSTRNWALGRRIFWFFLGQCASEGCVVRTARVTW